MANSESYNRRAQSARFGCDGAFAKHNQIVLLVARPGMSPETLKVGEGVRSPNLVQGVCLPLSVHFLQLIKPHVGLIVLNGEDGSLWSF